MNQVSGFNSSAYYNFKSNGLNTLRSPGSYKYFQGLAAIPPKTSIEVHKKHYIITNNIPKYKINLSYKLNNLNSSIESLCHQFRGKKIGVELSGGLDSSLVIEALLKLNLDPVLIGFCSDDFEFRTEREVQKYYQTKVSESILLNYEQNFAFENLKETPLHPIPVSESHFFQRHKTVATLAKKLNVDILLSGEAGDKLLSFPVNLEPDQEIPLDYGYWCLAEYWSNQYVYNKLGVEYLSGMALGSIPSIMLSLRIGQKWDPMKLWARNYFKNYLPNHLSNYAYTAFHNGWVVKGLISASEIVEEICELSYSAIQIEALRPDIMKKMAIEYGALSEVEKSRF